MKQIVVWLLVCQFASGHNLLAELLRTPSLIDHFKVHKLENPNLTVTSFFWLHYFNNAHETSDNRHESLPLHSAHGILAETTVEYLPDFPKVFPKICCDSAGTPLITDEFLRLTAPLSGVFRPPLA